MVNEELDAVKPQVTGDGLVVRIPHYRKDIDGLRAIAVLLVVAYHAGIPWLPRGFIGVDVFFVISGYLITGLILRELQDQRFSVLGFFYRRARRIVPAVSVVLVATWILGWFFLFPDEYRSLGKHVFAGASFISNIASWKDVGYFAPAGEFVPLLHLWSLGIEEQFYIAWPFFILVVVKFRGNLSMWLTIIFVVSLASFVHLSGTRPQVAFYLLPTRAWQLVAGAWLANLQINRGGLNVRFMQRFLDQIDGSAYRDTLRDLASGVGLLLILGAAFFHVGGRAASGGVTIAATLGAFIAIASGQNALINRLILARQPLVFVGLISYSLYLWHWPLLSIARTVNSGEISPAFTLLVVGVSFALSVVTWRAVEIPFRTESLRFLASVFRRSRGRAIVFYLGVLGIVGAVGLITYRLDGVPSRFPEALIKTLETTTFGDAPLTCLQANATEFVPDSSSCQSSSTLRSSVVVLGDSHAAHYFEGLVAYLGEKGIGATLLTHSGCGLFPGLARERGIDCDVFWERAIRYLTIHTEIETVIIAARFTIWFEGTRFGREAGLVVELKETRSGRYVDNESRSDYVAKSLADLVSSLIRAGKKVVILTQVPEMPVNVSKCYARGRSNCEVREQEVTARQRSTNDAIISIERKHPEICVFDAAPHFCDAALCTGRISGKILYMDNHHLNQAGSHYISQFFNFDRCLPVTRLPQQE